MNTRDDVKNFMIACDQPLREKPSLDVGNDFQAKLYMNLIAEEYKELALAWVDQDLVEIADACADLIWVIQGLNHTLGIPQQKVWDEVARSNMSKISENGKVLKRADGKVQKPESYSPPNIESIINDINN
jgi:predicted HAD superfamily Cof-like phosphohydrolase